MLRLSYVLSLSPLLLRLAAADFTLYPPVDAGRLAKAFGISTTCLQALNQTVLGCDQTLMEMVQDKDNYWWEADNMTTLCTDACSSATYDWDDAVQVACDGQTFNSYGKLVPADSISGRFVDGMEVACLQDSHYVDPNSNSTISDNSTTITGDNSTTPWCMLQSQNWTGFDTSDIDCVANPSDPLCSTNVTAGAEGPRLASLYTDDVLCSSCFVEMMYYRITSYFLSDSTNVDYLVDQLQDIGDVCETSIPDITIRAPPTYATASPTSSVYLGTGTPTPTSTPVASANCTGQTISNAAKRAPRVKGRSLEDRQSSSGCDALSNKYGVTTGDLLAASTSTDDTTCSWTGAVCLPKACKLQQVAQGATCASLASSIAGNVTTTQFLTWNPNILGLCDSLTAGQYVCVGPPGVPGGTYTLAPPPLGTDANAAGQARGGPGAETTTTVPAWTGAPPTATQTGIASNCNNWAMAVEGDECWSFSVNHGVNAGTFYALNPVLGADGANCNTLFWAKEYYCISTPSASVSISASATPISSSKPTSSSAKPTSSSASPTTGGSGGAAPGPTQTGIVAQCNKYATPATGLGCYDFATANGITPDTLYRFNTVLGSGGANCGSSFWGGEYYCVGVDTQPGRSPKCNKYAQAQGGMGCWDFANANGISTDNLYAWNTALGSGGSNCGTALWANEWYCIGVSS